MNFDPLQQPKPAAWKVLFNLTRGIAFLILQVLAALALDGWLSVALLAMAAWNALFIIVIIVGLAIVTQNALRERQARP